MARQIAVWAPNATTVDLVLDTGRVPMTGDDGWFRVQV